MIHDPRPDARLAAFCSSDGPEVFSGVVHGNQIWTHDPFDVESIHLDARQAFAALVERASSIELPSHGKTLLLLGEAGSGKTHLLRAFRATTHAGGTGYCGYLQMTSRVDNYARYVLTNLIDSLQHPYRQDLGPAAGQDVEDVTMTGLERLARGLLATVPLSLCGPLVHGEVADLDELARLVHRVSHAVALQTRFAGIDIDLIRAMLYLLPNDGLIHALALKWLRCEDLSRFDRESLGDLVPRPGPEMPIRTLVGLGKLMSAVHSASLVLLVDQIEEVIELSHTDGDAGPMLRGAINTLVDVADALPNAVVVVACLDDLFAAGRHFLPAPKLDRLEHDPAPVRLVSKRSADQVRAIVSRRLGALYDHAGIAVDPKWPTAPFTDQHLGLVAGMRTRDVVGFCRSHRDRCVTLGQWVEPDDAEVTPIERPSTAVTELGQLWNDFLSEWELGGVIGESTLADLLAWVAQLAPIELADGTRVDAWPEGRFVTFEVTADGLVEERVLAVCDVTPRGPHLLKQIDEVVEWAGDRPAVLVRSTEFPTATGRGGDAKSKVGERLVELARARRRVSPVVVQNAEWRAMEAFREFHGEHHAEPRFWDWQRADRPLTALPAVRAILDLDRVRTTLFEGPTVVPDDEPVAANEAPSNGGIRVGRVRSVDGGGDGGEGTVEIDAGTLVRHTMFVGGAGSGTTTASLRMVEELLLRGIPVVVVDRTGDFVRYADPGAWVQPESDPERHARRTLLRTRTDVRLYTPGADEGHPLVIPLAPEDLHGLPDDERSRLAGHIAAALGVWMGYRSKGPDPKVAILQAAIELLDQVGLVSVPALQDLIRERDTALLLGLGSLDDRHFETLLEDLETLWLRNRHLLEVGEVLDLGRMVRSVSGRAPLTVVDTRFLGDDATIDFWIAQLLVAFDRWGARTPSPDALRAVLLIDEAERCLPATGRPPASRAPLEGLLQRGSAAGIGVLLNTRSPSDLDYRCQSLVQTWLVGRLKEKGPATKLRPMFDAARTDPGPDLATGELHLLDGSDARAFQADPNLVASRQLTGDEVVRLAKELAG